jgi:D-alanyl-D-alanine carboxypeptidase (penicillin-binding protein 5/6)
VIPPRIWVAAAVAALVFVSSATAQAAAPHVTARAYLVENPATGEVLVQHGAWSRVPIASLTKLMTVLVTLDRARWNDVVRVRSDAAAVGESTVNLRAGERLTVGDLVKAALIQSANDAADALADYISQGDQKAFVASMNEKAKQLGLQRTHFVRPDGLDVRGHYSTAHDVTVLAQVAMRDPRIRSVVRLRTDTIAGHRRLHTWNDLLGVFPGVVGVKTGHTDDAGWCEVVAIRRSGYTVYVVVLGSKTRASRNAALASLLRWGDSHFQVAELVRSGRTYALTDPGWGKKMLPLVATRSLTRPFRVDRPVVQRIVAPAAVSLPVRRGQRLGRIEFWEGNRLLGTRALVAARTIARPGVGGRVAFYAGRTVHHVLGFFS